MSKHSTKGTFDFVQAIEELNIQQHQMFSLDVTSLFTSVPLNETIDYVCQCVETDEQDVGIPTEVLKKLLKLCTYNIQFQFNNEIYRQKDGVAMGSPLGPLLADFFMSKLENNQLKESIEGYTLYKRYVDDIIVFGPNNCDLDITLSHFNLAHPNIQFTIERESENKISFLDIEMVRRSDGSIQRKVHRKETWNDQYIHFDSFVPLQQKRNLIKCLTYRALRICSEEVLSDELQHLETIFTGNGYPIRFIQKTIQSVKLKPEKSTVEKKPVFISLPFKGDTVAELIYRRLKSAVENTFKASNLRMSFRTGPAFKLHLKDKLPKFTTSFCVYSFECPCKASYVGRTTRRLSDRVKEHCPVWLSQGLHKSSSSSIALHRMQCNHAIVISDAFQITYRVPRYLSTITRKRILAVAEAITIRLRKPDLCAQKQFVRTLKLNWPSPTQQLNDRTG